MSKLSTAPEKKPLDAINAQKKGEHFAFRSGIVDVGHLDTSTMIKVGYVLDGCPWADSNQGASEILRQLLRGEILQLDSAENIIKMLEGFKNGEKIKESSLGESAIAGASESMQYRVKAVGNPNIGISSHR